MASKRDRAAEQLNAFKNKQKRPGTLTTSNGAATGNKNSVVTIGPRGPVLLQDVVYLDEMGHFDRERIPERVVHAKGGGAHGYFEVTHDITHYTKASVFEFIGKRTPMFIRFSTVGGEQGSADTARDPRGFAMKFYAEDGNWDLVGNNTPIFFIRDPFLFPNFIHTQKRNPVTHLKDMDMFWDFITLRPETTHQVMFLFSDRGTPDGWRHMNGYGSHAFKFLNDRGEATYCKFHVKTNQGIKNIAADRAAELQGSDPDYAIRDLYNAIEGGDFPTWTFYVQIMTFAEAEYFHWNPFDVTKIWPHAQFPLIPVGKVVLNRNPQNYFAEVEQSAFCPAHVIPGVEASPDKMLQGRLFSYTDTHFHRLGTNYLHIPINCPYRARVTNYQRDGPQAVNGNQGDAPNYYPNSFHGPIDNPKALEHRFHCSGDVQRYNTVDDDNYSQPGNFWRKVLCDGGRQRLVDNITGSLKKAQPFIQDRAVRNFTQVDPEFGKRLRAALDAQPSKEEAMQRSAAVRARSSASQLWRKAFGRFFPQTSGDIIDDTDTPVPEGFADAGDKSIDADAIRARGFLKTRKAYTPPPNLEGELQRVVNELAPSDDDAWRSVDLQQDKVLKFKLLSLMEQRLGHAVPDSRLHELRTAADVLRFYEEPLQNTTSFAQLARSPARPHNLHVIEEPSRFHPLDTDAPHGGVNAYPGTGGSVVGLRNQRILRAFNPKKHWFDWEDKTFEFDRPPKGAPWDPEVAKQLDTMPYKKPKPFRPGQC